MKHQDLIKYHQMSPADLNLEIRKLEFGYTETKLKTALGQLKNTEIAKNTRRDIARLKTIRRSQQLSSLAQKAK